MSVLHTYKLLYSLLFATIILLLTPSLFAQNEDGKVKKELITGNNDERSKEIVNKQDVRNMQYLYKN